MNSLQLRCKDLIEYLGDSIDDNSIEHIKNVFSNIEKETTKQSESIYPQFERVGELGISVGGLTKLDYFAGRCLSIVDIELLEQFGCKDIAAQAYDLAEAMVEESEKRQQ